MRETASFPPTIPIRPTAEVVQGRYRLDRLLGRGGMADVYLAHDEHDGRDVAVKILRSSDPRLARRLAQEARALERLDHPNLVRLLGCEVAGDDAYLVMELVDAPTLARRLFDGPMGAAATAEVGAEVADALAYVHDRGIVHRDVKPANILVPEDGGARLADFGIARLLDASTLTLEQTTLGTAAYMAPEQLENHLVGPPADVWSLGIVLLECISGRRVYEGTPGEIIARRIANPVPPLDHLPPAWGLVLAAMLDHDPERRIPALEVGPMLRTPAVSEAQLGRRAGGAFEPTGPIDLGALNRAVARGGGAAAVGAAAEEGRERAAPAPAGGAAATTGATDWMTGRHPSPLALGRTRLWLVLLAVAIGLVAGIVALTHASASTGLPPVAAHRPAATTTTAKPAAPAVLTSAAALQTLQQAVAAAQQAGSMDPAHGQSVVAAATQAVADKANGNSPMVVEELQQAASVLAAGQQSGSISLDAAITVQNDLQSLAGALGLPGAAVPTTTTTTTTTTTAPPPPPPGPPPPHHHHHDGKGGQGGN